MAGKKYFQKQEVIWSEGEPARKVGIVLSGCVQVVSEDVFGNRNILEKLMPGELFGAAYACAGVGGSPVSVVAVTDSQVFQVDIQRVLEVCPASCPFHQQLIRNLVTILAGKNVMLGEKLRHLSKRTTREKLLSYLSETAKQKNARHFVIPFNRQELADYLCVERSAMSAELSKLRGMGSWITGKVSSGLFDIPLLEMDHSDEKRCQKNPAATKRARITEVRVSPPSRAFMLASIR